MSEYSWDIGEAAMVTIDDMTDLLVFIPSMDEEDTVPPAARFMIACGMRWKKDPKFVEEMLEWLSSDIRKKLMH
jgi:hypothetical protein